MVNRNLNFTNVCIVGCAFCGFGRGAGFTRRLFSLHRYPGGQIGRSGGNAAPPRCASKAASRKISTGITTSNFCARSRPSLPQLHVHAYSPMEITYGVEKTRLPLHEYLLMLKEAGLGSIPGTAAELLDDRVRKSLSPNKLKVRQWIEVIRTAHSLGIPTTSTMMYGHIELPEHWVRHLLLLREIQQETGGFTEFVPLGFIHSQTKLFKRGDARPGRSVHEDLIVHALSRILLNGYISNIQVSWVKLGFEESLACLEAGANDFGGTLMEESISKAAGANFGEYVSPGEFRALIRTIGRIPAERATSYQIRKVFEHPGRRGACPPIQYQFLLPQRTTRRCRRWAIDRAGGLCVLKPIFRSVQLHLVTEDAGV